jgi:hypothetical protein
VGNPKKESMTSVFEKLQNWYATNCDGDWEHEYGVRIETTDNPGWVLIVDLQQTDLYGRMWSREEISRSESWVSAKSDGKKFISACDPRSLERAIGYFIDFCDEI